MAVTKMATPGMVTQTISKVIEEAKVDVMLQNKYNVIIAKAMDIWPKNARTQGYLEVGSKGPSTTYPSTQCLCPEFCTNAIHCLNSTVSSIATGPLVCTE